MVAIDQVCYAATGSYLSYAAPYPYFFRTCSDDAFQGEAIAKLFTHFGWTNVATFSSTDSFGSDGIQQFTIYAEKNGINVLSAQQFRPGLKDFTEQIASASRVGASIFFFFMSGKDAGVLLEQGYNAGLFGVGTQIIGSGSILTSDTWNAMSADAPVQDIMKGVMALTQSFAFDTPELMSWAQRWRTQTDTIVIDPITGLETCASDLDDDGHFSLYRGVTQTLTSGGPFVKCAGLVFSTFNADGSNISPYAPFAYDAAIALAQGLHNTLYVREYANFTGGQLNYVMSMSNFSALGATGNISFRMGDATGYGFGDRYYTCY